LVRFWLHKGLDDRATALLELGRRVEAMETAFLATERVRRYIDGGSPSKHWFSPDPRWQTPTGKDPAPGGCARPPRCREDLHGFQAQRSECLHSEAGVRTARQQAMAGVLGSLLHPAERPLCRSRGVARLGRSSRRRGERAVLDSRPVLVPSAQSTCRSRLESRRRPCAVTSAGCTHHCCMAAPLRARECVGSAAAGRPQRPPAPRRARARARPRRTRRPCRLCTTPGCARTTTGASCSSRARRWPSRRSPRPPPGAAPAAARVPKRPRNGPETAPKRPGAPAAWHLSAGPDPMR